MITLFRRTLAVVMVVAAAVLAARMIAGPLTFPFSIRSPLNAEGAFAVAAMLLIVTGVLTEQARNASIQPLTRRDGLAFVAVVLMIALVFWRSATDYFLSDDFLMIRHAGDINLASFRTFFTTGGGDGFFRPLIYISYALTFPLLGTDPLRWHITELAIHVVNTLLVFAIARRLHLRPSMAWFAAALFAVHATRPEAVVWVISRFDLLATLFVLLSIWLFVRSERVINRGLALLAMLAALLCKESAYAGPLLLTLFVIRDRPGKSSREWVGSRLRTVTPFYLIAAGLFAYRWFLFGGIGGYVTQAGAPQVLSLNPLSVIKTLGLRLWAILFFPINWTIPLEPILIAATCLYMLALLWLVRIRAGRDNVMVAIAWIVISVLPPLQQLLVGADLQKSRYFYLPSVGFCLLLAVVSEHAKAVARYLMCGCVLAFHVAALEHNLNAWHYASDRALAACLIAASCARDADARVLAVGLPRILNGVYFFQNGFPECVRLHAPVQLENVRVVESPQAVGGPYTCTFAWDSATDTLRPSP